MKAIFKLIRCITQLQINCGLSFFFKFHSKCLTTFPFAPFKFQAFCHSKPENPWILSQLFMRGSSESTLDLLNFPVLIFHKYWHTFDETEFCSYLTFCSFCRIGRHHQICPLFSQGKWDISIVFRGCCEIIDIPLIKRNLRNHHSAFFGKRCVNSAESFPRNLSRKKLGDPLTRESESWKQKK